MDRLASGKEATETSSDGVYGPSRPSSCWAVRSALSSLARIDDFNCEKIGSGFFSEVFKVQHRVTGQVMALKVNTMACNRVNMLREVELMNKLNHPNILRFMGVCVHQGHLHALTEYINGGNLEQLLANAVPLSWLVRQGLALDLARGLEYLHSQHFFHRDLTSKNCLVRCRNGVIGNQYSVLVGDLGLAERIPQSSGKQLVGYRGSPYWMAPEVLKGESYDERVDVFAYGVILCEIIGRIQADPDFLPRTADFGLNVEAFRQMAAKCPLAFLNLAIICCCVKPEGRPSFSEVVVELEKRKELSDGEQDEQESAGEDSGTPNGLPWRRQSLGVPSDARLPRSKSAMLPAPPGPSAMPKFNPFIQHQDQKNGPRELRNSARDSSALPPPLIPAPCGTAPDGKFPPRLHRRCQSLPCTPEIVQFLQMLSQDMNGDGLLDNRVNGVKRMRGIKVADGRNDAVISVKAETVSQRQEATDSPRQNVMLGRDEDSLNVETTQQEMVKEAMVQPQPQENNEVVEVKEEWMERKSADVGDDCFGISLAVEFSSLKRETEDGPLEPMDCTRSVETPAGALIKQGTPLSNTWSPPISNTPLHSSQPECLDNNNSTPVCSWSLGLRANSYSSIGTSSTPK